jgi:hypothetical protein
MSLQNPTHGHHEPGEPEMIAVPRAVLVALWSAADWAWQLGRDARLKPECISELANACNAARDLLNPEASK